MSLFDFPDPNATTEERPTTIGPLQGLFFLNSKFIAEQAKALATRVEKEGGADGSARIRKAYGLLFAREPDADREPLVRLLHPSKLVRSSASIPCSRQ